jgi:hypothetical protein
MAKKVKELSEDDIFSVLDRVNQPNTDGGKVRPRQLEKISRMVKDLIGAAYEEGKVVGKIIGNREGYTKGVDDGVKASSSMGTK